MITIEIIREWLGWCTLINLGLLIFTSIMLVFVRGPILEIHTRLLDLDEASLKRSYLRYLATYKIVFLVFNLVPYLALRIMA